jgi:hypothetical protein
VRFTIQNLGRLEEATIDLGKDLIVLTGPNNTSKTYVAHAIYGFCYFLESSFLGAAAWNIPTQQNHTYIEFDLLETIGRDLAEVCGLGSKGYAARLPEVLAASRSFTEGAHIDLRFDDHEIEEGKSRILAQEEHAQEFGGKILIDKSPGSGTWAAATRMAPMAGTRSSEQHAQEALPNLLILRVLRAFTRALFAGLTSPQILTSERSAVEIFSRELAAKRFEQRGQNEPPPAYPLALAESLKAAQQMASAQNSPSRYAGEADRLEREILNGRLDIGSYGEMRFVPTGTTQHLDMNLSSSSVKSLASLSFYLRHRDDP